MKFDIKHFLIFGLALGMTSCVETMKDGDMSTGFLGIPVLDADIQVEEFGATKAAPSLPTLSVPESSALHFKVTGSDSKVVWDQDGLWSTPLKMPVGKYTIDVNYGSNTYGDPWYTGTCNGTISAVTEAEPATIRLSLCNSLLAVVLADAFTQHFTPSEGKCVTISSTSSTSGSSRSITTTLGKYVFVPAGEALTIEVAGTSSAGVDKTLSWTLTQLSAATATYVTCSLTTTDAPKITMSEIPVADAWGNTAYVPLATTENISEANVEKMQYFASSNDWTNSVEGTVDGGTVKFTGLTPGATYKVRAQLGALKSNEVSMTMSTSALSIKAAAAHTYTNSELDGTDFTASFSVLDKFGVSAASLSLCKTDGTVLRTVALKGASADWTSDGSTLTGDDTWPFLPDENYILKGTATQNGSSVTLEDLPISVPATPDFTVTVTGTTTYDLYSNGDITAANAADAESITGIEYSVSGIAQRLKDNKNYSYKEELLLDNVDIKGITSVSKQSWAPHTLIAKVTFASKEITAQKDCHITGLPYKKDFTSDKSTEGWIGLSTSHNLKAICLGYNYGSGTITYEVFSPIFRLPKTTKISYTAIHYYGATGGVSPSGTICSGVTNNNTTVRTQQTSINGNSRYLTATLKEFPLKDDVEMNNSSRISLSGSCGAEYLVENYVELARIEILYRSN